VEINLHKTILQKGAAMYGAAIKVLKDKVESMSRVCGLYQFSQYPQDKQVEYIEQMNEIDSAVAALETMEGALCQTLSNLEEY